MKQHSKTAWKIASLYSNVLASETRDLAAHIDAALEPLREALKPFADYYEQLERNGRLEGHMLISQQGDTILGHAGIQTRDLKAAHEALNQQLKE